MNTKFHEYINESIEEEYIYTGTELSRKFSILKKMEKENRKPYTLKNGNLQLFKYKNTDSFKYKDETESGLLNQLGDRVQTLGGARI